MESPSPAADGAGPAEPQVKRTASEGTVSRRVVYRGKSGSVLLSSPPPKMLPPAPVPVERPAVPMRPMSPPISPRELTTSPRPAPPAKPAGLVSPRLQKPSPPAKPAVAAPADRPLLPGKPGAGPAPPCKPAKPQIAPKPLVPPKAFSDGEAEDGVPAVPSKPAKPLVAPKPASLAKAFGSDGEGPDDQAPPPPAKPRALSAGSTHAVVHGGSDDAKRVAMELSDDEEPDPQEPPDSDASDTDSPSTSLARSQNTQEEYTRKRKGTFSTFIRTMSNPNFVKKEKAAAAKAHPLTTQKATPLSEEQLQATLPPMKKTKHLKSPESYFRPVLQYAVDMQFVSFDEVQALYPGERLINRVVPQAKLGSKKFMKPFANVVETFLNIPNIYMQSWSEVFYARMVQFQNVLSANHVEALRLVVDYYVQQLGPAERQSHLRTRALELFTTFLQTHRYDPDSALIGLAPGRVYRGMYEKFLQSRDSHKKDTEADLSKKQLLDLITAWAEIDSEEKIGKKVKAFVHNMRHRAVTMLAEGDLVIVQLPWAYVFGHEGESESENEGDEQAIKAGMLRRQNTLQSRRAIQVVEDNVVIARFAGREPDGVLVWHTAQELVKVKVEASSVFPFTRDMLDLLGKAKAMQALVSDGADQLNSYLREHLKTLVANYLAENDIDIAELKRANNNEATLHDLFRLRRYRDVLDKIVAAPDDLLNRVDSFSSQVIAKFTESLQHRDLFQPMRSQTLSELGSWPYCSLAKSRIKRWQGVVDSTLMQLDIDKRLILNSTRKLQLSEWWLGLIRSSVKQLLMDNMYDFHAVNSDYIESPPDDIDSIRQNLELIQEILSPRVDKHGVVEKLIKPLTARIYPKLDELVELMYIVLMDQDFEHGQTSVKEFNLAQYEGRLREATGEPGGPSAELSARLQSLVKDARYIHEMKSHEKNFRQEQEAPAPGLQRAKSFVMVDAVPVSGLIMNYFHRMEVELKTVLELWVDQDTIDNWHRQRGNPVPARVSRPQRVVHNRLPPGAAGAELSAKKEEEEGAAKPSVARTASTKIVMLDQAGKKMSLSGVRAGQLAKVRANAIALPRPPSLMRESDSEGEEEKAEGVQLRLRPVTRFEDPTARLSTHDLALLSPRSVRANASKLPPLESPRREPLSSSPLEQPGISLSDVTSSAGEGKAESTEAAAAGEERQQLSDGSEEEQDPRDDEEVAGDKEAGAARPLKRMLTDTALRAQPMVDDDDMIIDGF